MAPLTLGFHIMHILKFEPSKMVEKNIIQRKMYEKHYLKYLISKQIINNIIILYLFFLNYFNYLKALAFEKFYQKML